VDHITDCIPSVQIYIKQVYSLSGISELERIGEEVVMVYFKVLPNHLPGVTEKPQKSLVRMVCAMDDVQTRHILNTSQNYHLSQLAWLNIRGLIYSPAVETRNGSYFIPLGPQSRGQQKTVFRLTFPVR
jgi:hypothetical protein